MSEVGATKRWPRLNIRVIVLLVGLAGLISATVIATDMLSPRDRQAGTMPATTGQ